MTQEFDDEDVARLRIALAKIARLVDRQVSDDGLTRTQLSVLGTVARLDTVPISELADIEGLNPTMLSRLVGKLEVAGLVTRATDETDRRAVQVRITKAGTALHLRRRRERTKLFAERLELLTEERARRLLQALPALEDLAEQMRQPARVKAGAR